VAAAPVHVRAWHEAGLDSARRFRQLGNMTERVRSSAYASYYTIRTAGRERERMRQ
jgi:hypothetical protein